MIFLIFYNLIFHFPIIDKTYIYEMRCQRGDKHFDIHFWLIRSVLFPSKYWKDAYHGGRNGRKDISIPPESAFQPLMLLFVRVIWPLFILTWRVNNYFSREGKGIYRRNESTEGQLLLILLTIIVSRFFSPMTIIITVNELISIINKS